MIFYDEMGSKYETVHSDVTAVNEFVIRPYKKPDTRKHITVKAELIHRDESEYVSDYVGLKFNSRGNAIWIRKEELVAE